ncbi:MAG: nicotinate-nucleotide--dimethylbenzimidazole phosphoribosyltransferase [Nitrospira sp.]|nr:nicotinate-nucleotide--dimethylbenzimidazole phosphoribosyltransferase [Nitrospira sp.]
MDIKQIISHIQPTRQELSEVAQERLDRLTKPSGSLGRLEEFARRLVTITGETMPVLNRKVIFTFAGDHGVADEGVSAFPKEVTRQMVFNFLRGGAGINVLARHAKVEVVVIDIGVDYDFVNTPPSPPFDPSLSPLIKGGIKGGCGGLFVSKKVVMGTKNIRNGPAMTQEEAIRCIEVGINLAEDYTLKGYKIFGAGEMGIANTTPSSAIAAVLTRKSISEVTGRGTGIGDEALRNKIKVIEDAILINKPDPSDPIDVLSKVGGAEIGGIAGLILGAAAHRVPVVIDGFISTAGALIAYCLEPRTKDYMFAAHNSVEIGHKAMLKKIGLQPILDLNLRLGEGTGAALAMLIIEAGLKIYKDMATFGEAGVSGKDHKEKLL